MNIPQIAKQQDIKFEDVGGNKYGHRILLYGPAGVGKTTLACLANGPVVFFDLEEKLDKLKPKLEEDEIIVPKKVTTQDWERIILLTKTNGYSGIGTVVYDTVSVAEQLNSQSVIKKSGAKSIEEVGGGYGKGYKYTFEEWVLFLSYLDMYHIRCGRNVILIAHSCSVTVPDPSGKVEFIRWEPRMQDQSKDKGNSIRARTLEWADHILFLSPDVSVDPVGSGKHMKPGRAQGGNTRTLHTSAKPWFVAKSISTDSDIDIQLGVSPWDKIIK